MASLLQQLVRSDSAPSESTVAAKQLSRQLAHGIRALEDANASRMRRNADARAEIRYGSCRFSLYSQQRNPKCRSKGVMCIRKSLAMVVLISGTVLAQTRFGSGVAQSCVPVNSWISTAPSSGASNMLPHWWGSLWGGRWNLGVNGEDRWDPPVTPPDYICFPAPPSIVVVAPPPAVAVAPEPPPPPAHAQMREYQWQESKGHSTPTLSIVLKDGTVGQALAVCEQETKLTYVTPQGTGEEIGLESVDLDATRRSNAPINAN